MLLFNSLLVPSLQHQWAVWPLLGWKHFSLLGVFSVSLSQAGKVGILAPFKTSDYSKSVNQGKVKWRVFPRRSSSRGQSAGWSLVRKRSSGETITLPKLPGL